MSGKEHLTFSINSRLLEQLGENLVTKDHVALAELIKNAYDADATSVRVEFENARQRKGKKSEIRIIDNGVGMTFEQVRDNWMQIATPDKLRNPRSEVYGRPKTGDKGIGRFACRRLAKELHITSTSETDDDNNLLQRTSFHIEWEDYTEENQIEEVPVDVTVETVENADTGVELRLVDLENTWNQQSFNTLRRNVLTLSIVRSQQREDFPVDPGFDIEFDAPEFDKGEGTLLEQFHDAGWGCLEGRIDSNGEVRLQLDAKLLGRREYSLPKQVSGLENTSFKISYIPRKKDHFRDPQTLSMSNAREIMNEYGGVRVYDSGFRVFPYGDQDDDWLGIDRYHAKRVGAPDDVFEPLEDNLDYHRDFGKTMQNHPKNNQLVGRVNVGSDSALTMKTDREGFIQSEPFEELKQVVRLSLQWMTLQYSHYLHEKTKKEQQEAVDNLRDGLEEDDDEELDVANKTGTSASIQIVEYMNEAAMQSIPEEDRAISDDVVEQATTQIRTDIDRKQAQIRFYQSAFSVTQFIFNFSHELRGVIGTLGTNAGTIERIGEELPHEQQLELGGVAEELRAMRERIQDQMKMFGTLMEQSREQEGKPQNIDDAVEEVRSTVQPVLDYYEMTLQTEVPDSLETPKMLKSELYSILLNLVTNSVKATIASDSDGGEILVTSTSTSDGVGIRVLDSGIGLPEGQRETVFKELVTDPSNELYPNLREKVPQSLIELIGTGTGLGLSIVRNIASDHGGQARFIDTDDWTTGVEVTLNE